MGAGTIKYTLALSTEDGAQYDISNCIEDLGWEQNEDELAARISFSVKADDAKLLEILKIGCIVSILTDGIERVRGTVNTAKTKESSSEKTISVTAYDDLFSLQKSEDNLFFPAGQTTKAILTQIFTEWGVPIGGYNGADVQHEKLVYRSGTLADNILDILDDAEKKGGPRSIIRASEGKVFVLQRGSNTDIYQFTGDSSVSLEQEISIADLVTRVKVIANQDSEEGLPPVEALLDGLTQFGIRQKIYKREKDANAAEVQAAAQKILDEDGVISKTLSLTAPDVPVIQKGDVIYVKIGELDGYYYVNGIQHDAASGTMSMQIEQREEETVVSSQDGTGQTVEGKKEYKAGDVVQFAGGMHYVSSYAGSQGSVASAGPAQIYKDKNCAGNGGAHPWCLIHTDATSNVYGWVDDGTFT